jgi:allantoinase
MAQAFVADQVVTPQGARRAALLLEEGPASAAGAVIRAVCEVGDLPAGTDVVDFGARAMLPGLVDTHVHINEPGRTEYDNIYRLTSETINGSNSVTYGLDPVGNRSSQTSTISGVPSGTFNFNSDDLLLGGVETYDANGNTLTRRVAQV